jgi:Siphovirus Gp157
MELYKISNMYQEALFKLSDLELPDEVIADTLEGLKGELIDKSKNVAAFIRNLEADAYAIKQAAKQMNERGAVIQRRVDYMKKLLLDTMQANEITEISCTWFLIKPKKNPHAVKVTDSNLLAKKYKKEVTTMSIDKQLIASDLKQGAVVVGAELTQGWRLDIK